MAEISVVSDEGRIVVDADLRDQSVRNICFESGLQNASSKFAGTLPVAIVDREKGQTQDKRHKSSLHSGTTERLGKNDRRKSGLAAENRFSRTLNVHPWLTSRPPSQ